MSEKCGLYGSIKTTGENLSPEQIQQAVDNYLNKNPVHPGELVVENHILKLKGEVK